MSIPLNIDWQQILLHLLNFAILFFGLYMLLYKPVKAFMDKREETIKKMNDEAKEKLDLASSYEEKVKSRLSGIEEEAKKEKVKMLDETRKEIDLKLSEAKKEADKIIEDAKVSGENEKQKIINSAGKDIVELATSAAYKILEEEKRHE